METINLILIFLYYLVQKCMVWCYCRCHFAPSSFSHENFRSSTKWCDVYFSNLGSSLLVVKYRGGIVIGKPLRRRAFEIKAEVEFVNADEAKKLVAVEGYAVLDVRDKTQFERAHIKNCYHVPLFIENTDNDLGISFLLYLSCFFCYNLPRWLREQTIVSLYVLEQFSSHDQTLKTEFCSILIFMLLGSELFILFVYTMLCYSHFRCPAPRVPGN